MANHQLSVILKLKDEATKQLTHFQRSLKGTTDFVKAHKVELMAAAAVVVGGLTMMVKKSMDYANELDKMSKQADITTEEFSRLAYAAEQEHASMEILTKSFPILTKAMSYAQEGMVTYKREFDKMGITVTNSSGKLKTTNEVFLEMADYYSTATDKTQALAIAATLLGRRGAELEPMLKLGRKGLEELGDEAERTGIVLDEDTVKAVKKLDDEMTKIWSSCRGAGLAFTKELIPGLEAFAEAANEHMPEILRAFSALGRFVEQTLTGWRLIAGLTTGPAEELEVINHKIIEIKKSLAKPAIFRILPEFALIEGLEKLEKKKLELQEEVRKEFEKYRYEQIDIHYGLGKDGKIAGEEQYIEQERIRAEWSATLKNLGMQDTQAELEELAKRYFQYDKFEIDKKKLAEANLKEQEKILKASSDAKLKAMMEEYENLQKFANNTARIMSAAARLTGESWLDTAAVLVEGFARAGEAILKIKAAMSAGTGRFWEVAIALSQLAVVGMETAVALKSIEDQKKKLTEATLGDIANLPAAAEGANIWRRGSLLVGERGPELINLSAGAQVTPLTSAQKNQAAAGNIGGQTINITQNFTINGEFKNIEDIRELSERLAMDIERELRRSLRRY